MANRSETQPPLSPERRITILEDKVTLVSRSIVSALQLKGGGVYSRLKPDTDHSVIAERRQGNMLFTLDIYGAGIWGGVQEDTWTPIGKVDETPVDSILFAYTPLVDSGLEDSLSILDNVDWESLSDEEKIKFQVEKVKPIADTYINTNRERLLTSLVGDMRKALGRALQLPPVR